MNKRTLRKRISILAVVVWMIVIFSFSAQPDTESSAISGHVSYRIVETWNQVFHLDHDAAEMEQIAEVIEYPVRKCAHMSEYGVLALLFLQLLSAFGIRKKRAVIALMLTAAYASTDEFHQLFVPGRAGKVTDVLIDSTGALIALLAIEGILYYHKTKSKKRKR